MKNNLVVQVLITWALFVPIAIGNGVARDLLYKPFIGDLLAHQISTLIACLLFLLLVYTMFSKKLNELQAKSFFIIGGIWVGMTISFEFLFGYFVDHASIHKLLADYNIFSGRVWIIFLLVEFLSLFIVKYMRSKKTNEPTTN